MIQTFMDMRLKFKWENLDTRFDHCLIDNPQHVVQFFNWIMDKGEWSILAALFTMPMNLEGFDHHPHRAFYLALSNDAPALNIYLMSLSEAQLAVHRERVCHLSLCYLTNGLDSLELLLSGPTTNETSQAYIKLFRWAAKSGCTEVVRRLVLVPEVKAAATAYDNKALCSAAENAHREVVYCLLELPQVRCAELVVYTAQACGLVSSGLKRSLWLALKDDEGFQQVHNFEQLRLVAERYLKQHEPWMSQSEECNLSQGQLLSSLKEQILSLAYYDPLNQLSLQYSTPLQVFFEARLGREVSNLLQPFHAIPSHLDHMSQHSAIATVASRCLEGHMRERREKNS